MEHSCPKCGTALANARPNIPLSRKLAAFKEPVQGAGNKASPLALRVCPKCGYVEWYAENPEDFA